MGLSLLGGAARGGAPTLAPLDDRAHVEVTFDRLLVPEGELLGWALEIDGAQVSGAGRGSPLRWEGMLRPGQHRVKAEVRYRRDLKTVVQSGGAHGLALTFVAGDACAVSDEHTVLVSPSSVVQLTLGVDDDPTAVEDRLVIRDSFAGNTWVEVGDSSAWAPSQPMDCDGGDRSACTFRNFRRLFRAERVAPPTGARP